MVVAVCFRTGCLLTAPSYLLQVGEALGKAKGNEIKAIAGKLTDAETLISAKVT